MSLFILLMYRGRSIIVASISFIPDCVCVEGPSPSEKWVSVVTTPPKSLGKRTVTPGPYRRVAFPAFTEVLQLPPQVSLHPPASPLAPPLGAAVQRALFSSRVVHYLHPTHFHHP